MRRIYHNWYSRRMKACFTVLHNNTHDIWYLRFLIQPLRDMHIDQQQKSIIITKSGNKQVSL